MPNFRPVIIRIAKAEDVEAIHALGQKVDEFATSKTTVAFWPKSILKTAVEDATVIIFVVEVEGKMCGFIIANCNKPLSKVLIENLYVQPAHRGQNIGIKLVQALINEARAQGYDYFATLVPLNDTPAIKTYQKAGFTLGEQFLWLDYSTSNQFRKGNS